MTLFIRFLRQYNSGIQKLVKIPFIDSILLNVLQLLKQRFSKIDKRGVQIRSEGWEKFSKIYKRGRGSLLGTKEYFACSSASIKMFKQRCFYKSCSTSDNAREFCVCWRQIKVNNSTNFQFKVDKTLHFHIIRLLYFGIIDGFNHILLRSFQQQMQKHSRIMKHEVRLKESSQRECTT